MARFAAYEGGTRPTSMEGKSYHGAYAIAFVQWLTGQEPCHDLAVSATVDLGSSGLPLERVEHLKAKLRILAEWALGVDRVVVCNSQVQEATTIAAGLPRSLRVVGASSLPEVVSLAFPTLAEDTRRAIRSVPGRARQVEDNLFRVALHHPESINPWRGALDACELLAGHPDVAEARIQFTRTTLKRHLNNEFAPLPLGVLDMMPDLPLGRRLEAAAHLMQHTTGISDDTYFDQALSKASSLIPENDLDCFGPHLALHGALGRAHAARLNFDLARKHLETAICGWFLLDEVHRSSIPLCERLRVASLSGGANEIDEVLKRYRERFEADDALSPLSQAHFVLAMGRAWIQCGSPEAGVRELERQLAWESDTNVNARRQRFLAVAADAMGDRQKAQRIAEGITEPTARLLARADAGENVMDLLRSSANGTVQLLLGKGLNAAQVARYYP